MNSGLNGGIMFAGLRAFCMFIGELPNREGMLARIWQIWDMADMEGGTPEKVQTSVRFGILEINSRTKVLFRPSLNIFRINRIVG